MIGFKSDPLMSEKCEGGLQKTLSGESGAFCFDQVAMNMLLFSNCNYLYLFYHFTFYGQILMFSGVSVPKAVHAQTSILFEVDIMKI